MPVITDGSNTHLVGVSHNTDLHGPVITNNRNRERQRWHRCGPLTHGIVGRSVGGGVIECGVGRCGCCRVSPAFVTDLTTLEIAHMPMCGPHRHIEPEHRVCTEREALKRLLISDDLIARPNDCRRPT